MNTMVRLVLIATLALAAGCGGGNESGGPTAPAAGALPDITALKPFVLEKDGGFHALIDVAPLWAQVEARGDAAARKELLGAALLMVLRRDGLSKFAQAQEFQVKLVRVTEYDSYNRPMIATGKEICTGKVPATQVPADLTPATVQKTLPATAGLQWTDANLK